MGASLKRGWGGRLKQGTGVVVFPQATSFPTTPPTSHTNLWPTLNRGGGCSLPDFGKGQKKHINFFSTNFLLSTQNAPLWAPRKKLICDHMSHFLEITQRWTHITFLGKFRGQKRAPNRAFWATKALGDCFFLACPLLLQMSGAVVFGVASPSGFKVGSSKAQGSL